MTTSPWVIEYRCYIINFYPIQGNLCNLMLIIIKLGRDTRHLWVNKSRGHMSMTSFYIEVVNVTYITYYVFVQKQIDKWICLIKYTIKRFIQIVQDHIMLHCSIAEYCRVLQYYRVLQWLYIDRHAIKCNMHLFSVINNSLSNNILKLPIVCLENRVTQIYST